MHFIQSCYFCFLELKFSDLNRISDEEEWKKARTKFIQPYVASSSSDAVRNDMILFHQFLAEEKPFDAFYFQFLTILQVVKEADHTLCLTPGCTKSPKSFNQMVDLLSTHIVSMHTFNLVKQQAKDDTTLPWRQLRYPLPAMKEQLLLIPKASLCVCPSVWNLLVEEVLPILTSVSQKGFKGRKLLKKHHRVAFVQLLAKEEGYFKPFFPLIRNFFELDYFSPLFDVIEQKCSEPNETLMDIAQEPANSTATKFPIDQKDKEEDQCLHLDKDEERPDATGPTRKRPRPSSEQSASKGKDVISAGRHVTSAAKKKGKNPARDAASNLQMVQEFNLSAEEIVSNLSKPDILALARHLSVPTRGILTGSDLLPLAEKIIDAMELHDDDLGSSGQGSQEDSNE